MSGTEICRRLKGAGEWGIDADIETRAVDANVKRLRRKLGIAGDSLETVRGVGYRMREE